MPLNARFEIKLAADLTKAGDLSTATDPLAVAKAIALLNGSGLGQADRIWHDQRTLAASGTENLDLSGSLLDRFGDGFVLTKLKGLYVAAAAGNTNNVNVIREGTNGVPLFLALGDGIPVHPGGAFLWVAPSAAGVTVTAATGDLLTFTNSGAGTGVTYDVVIVGAA